MDYIKKAKRKAKVKSMTKKQWGLIAFRIFIIAVALFSFWLGMHLCGYNIVTFMKNYYAWFVLGAVFIISIVVTIFYDNVKKK